MNEDLISVLLRIERALLLCLRSQVCRPHELIDVNHDVDNALLLNSKSQVELTTQNLHDNVYAWLDGDLPPESLDTEDKKIGWRVARADLKALLDEAERLNAS